MNQKGKGPDWMFDLDILTPSLNYIPVRKENQVDTAVKQSNSVDFEDVDDQQFIVHGSSSIGNKAVSGAIKNDAQNKDSDESTIDKEVPLTIEDQDLQKEFENLMLQETIAHSHMEIQGIASEKRKEKGKEIYDLSESDDDLPKDGIFDGNSFDDENKDSEEEIDLDLNNMDNTIDVSSSSTLRIHKNHPQSQIIGPTASGVKTRKQLQGTPAPYPRSALLSFIYNAMQEGTASIQASKCIWVLCDFQMEKELLALNGSSENKRHERGCRIEAIRIFLAFTSFMDFFVYHNGCQNVHFCMAISQKRNIKPATTPIEAHKSLGKDEEGEDVDVHLYRSMIGCLMYLTTSRPDIMFAVCLCARFQVTPKISHMHAVKRIFRYLKHQPKLGLWYPKDSPFHLEAFSDSDYAGDNHDRRSTSGGCQYLGRRLVSWQCKKQTIVAISSTEAEYVAAACLKLIVRGQVRIINEVAHIEAKVAGKKILVSEASVRTNLMFNDKDGTNILIIKVIWDTLRDIMKEVLHYFLFLNHSLDLNENTLVHTLLHCLSSKSSSWDQFGTNIASALVGLATNQKFNFSKLVFDGMLRNLKDSKPFLMYPRFIQLFLNKQLEGIPKPQTFLPTVVLPPKVFTFMSKCSPKFSGKLTPLTPPMLEVVTAVRAKHSLHTEEEENPTSSHHSDDSSAGDKADNTSPAASERLASPNDYTPTDEVQTSGGDEGNLDLYGLNREVLSLKKQNAKQAAQILRLKKKIKILVKNVQPVIDEYRSFVKIQASLSKKKKLKKAHKQKSSSFKQGRKKVYDGSTSLNEVDVNEGTEVDVNEGTEVDVNEGTEVGVNEGAANVNEVTAEETEGTAGVIKGTAEVYESTAGANLSTGPSMKVLEDEAGPSTFQDESDEFIQDDTLIADILVNISRPRRGAGITIPGNISEQQRPESPTLILDPKDKGKGIMKEEPKKKKLTLQQLRAAETANDEEVARKVAAEWEEEKERKRIAGLERLQAELEDDEMIAAELQRTKRENFTEEQKAKFLVETIAAQRRFRAKQQATLRRSKPPTISQLRNQMMKYIRNVGGKAYKNRTKVIMTRIQGIFRGKVKRFNDKFVAIGSTEDEQAIKEMNVKAEEPSKKRKGTIRKMKSSRIIKKRKIQKSDDELKDFLKVVNFEDDCAQDVEVMEQHSLISRFSIVQSPEGEYIVVQRANGHIRAFNTLNEILHILDRQDLYHLHRLVIEYYEHIPPTGLGLILHGDLTTMMETTEESDDELWRNQTEWEIISWRFYESTGVHILELENGTMIHMLVEQRYPLTRELMQRMLEHKLEVQKETEDALNVIRFVMKQKEDLEREEE
ncbi:hypothetical protein Tco_0657454 [Tanacetum coccineum]|uniref:Reverse transcriptase Ty1/copia-type domain-containing protein n=1 Tax=Tanacetum coccineum TaxID=301880 RepID=A0ABQ4XBL8_9ASTR